MRTTTTVNAGSMADIAFLMLIFFLTTTTIETDKGLNQTLPEPCESKDCSSEIAERNLFRISANSEGNYLVNDELTPVELLSEEIIQFVTNPDQLESKPALPEKAVISFQFSRELDYRAYVEILDQVKAAYHKMRAAYSQQKFLKDLDQLSESELKQVLEAYPLNLGESTPEVFSL
ncbi:ExbD/TolR family protein [Leeuwenhoekiella nanhaiensis]|uniref:Biopolymer transporter ExbD n=1 Tax=Leeuwenhoekiella nanhaiensis TaxID=1655491 RepID=A0A2G1VR02_9FLAO|nr:biopolymer transporter ExbD [Leeuwenhoekiella nanhaiensis]PHQ29050.1 hypothetical protein CJ305_12750 [Leeuwenhoekiella nanhaiensis]